MKDDFFSVNFLIIIAVLLSIVLVGYNAFLMPDYVPAVVTYLPEEVESPLASGFASEESEMEKASAVRVNLNEATAEELQTISGIGPVMAEKLLRYRDEVGVITSIDEIKNVDGIGDATYNKIAPHLVLE